MKTILFSAVIASVLSFSSVAQDGEQEVKEASKETILSMLALCKNYAVEDQVPASEMDEYLLLCVNDELEMNYYKPIKKLPKA